MTAGIIPVTSIPGWPNLSDGILQHLAAITPCFVSPDGLHVGDVTAAQSFLSAFSGSATELSHWQSKTQTALDALLDNNFDLKAFIRAGTASSITAANVGTFLATITNNYRGLRAQIAAATTVAQVQAININAGWPNNP